MVTKAEESAADSPPAYTAASAPVAPVPDVARCNFVSIERTHNKIDGVYVVDPSMDVPEELLTPFQGAVRPNLRLASTHGAIDADVWVVPANLGDVKGSPKTTLSFENKHGKIDIRMHALGSLPCSINAHTTHGKVSLLLPPNFVGLITTTTTHGSVEVPRQLMRLGESKGVARYFVGLGDQVLSLGSGTWEGSAIDVKTTHGGIKIATASNPTSLP